jgi:radical SAM superfamily enzyme YgiQ (UPF0313 family)
MQENIDILFAYPAENATLHSSMIPLGIASIAAVLEDNNYNVKVVDFNYYNGDFSRDLLKWNPGVIGIGGTTPTRKGSFEIARQAKNALPDVPVVYGGVHATFTASDTLNHIREIDYILKGECDFTFLEFCDKIIRGKEIDLHSIPGLCYRENNKIIENKPERIDDLSSLPLPARHLFDNNFTLNLDFYNVKAAMIITSRGCPKTCTFCSASRMFPGGVRQRPIVSIQAEIESLVESSGIKGLKIFDSTFTADRDFVLKFCEMIKPYSFLWECEIRVDTVDFELLKTMKEAGCCYIDIGLETTNDRLLKSLNKKIAVKQAEDVLNWCGELGIKTKLFFIFGLLGETFNECLTDVRWLRKHRNQIDYFANTYGVTIYPGTVLEKQAKDKALIHENFSWAEFKPPMKNMFLLDFKDVLILFQKQLSPIKIIIIGLLLNLQRTNLNPKFVLKVFRNLYSGITAFIKLNFKQKSP